MNGAERVFAAVRAYRRSIGARDVDMARFLGVPISQVQRWRTKDNMSDGALLVVHDRTDISVRRLLKLRACKRMPHSPPTSRQRFENWAGVESRYTRRDGETYHDPVVAICWKAWKAALNQT